MVENPTVSVSLWEVDRVLKEKFVSVDFSPQKRSWFLARTRGKTERSELSPGKKKKTFSLFLALFSASVPIYKKRQIWQIFSVGNKIAISIKIV